MKIDDEKDEDSTDVDDRKWLNRKSDYIIDASKTEADTSSIC